MASYQCFIVAEVAQIQKAKDQMVSQTAPPPGQSEMCWLVTTIGCGILGVGISTNAGCYLIMFAIDAAIEAAGGGPEDPLPDIAIAGFDDDFLATCYAEVSAHAVYTTAGCVVTVTESLGISC